jgi:hypothetical protein
MLPGKKSCLASIPGSRRPGEDLHEIMDRAMMGLQRILKAIEEHPGTGQAERLTRFLAGVYNGNAFPFDLTDLRVLDAELTNACIAICISTDWVRWRCTRICPRVAGGWSGSSLNKAFTKDPLVQSREA